jgi:hypothetical protein
MNISKKKGSNFLQTISNKIATMESAYEIDEEYPKLNNNKNTTNLNTSNPELIQENNNINNILLKESIISPNDINTNNLKESNISQNEIQPPSPQSLSSINSVYCKYHNKSYLKLKKVALSHTCCISKASIINSIVVTKKIQKYSKINFHFIFLNISFRVTFSQCSLFFISFIHVLI